MCDCEAHSTQPAEEAYAHGSRYQNAIRKHVVTTDEAVAASTAGVHCMSSISDIEGLGGGGSSCVDGLPGVKATGNLGYQQHGCTFVDGQEGVLTAVRRMPEIFRANLGRGGGVRSTPEYMRSVRRFDPHVAGQR